MLGWSMWSCLLGEDSEEVESDGMKQEWEELPSFVYFLESEEEDNKDVLHLIEKYKACFQQQEKLSYDGSGVNRLTAILKALTQLKAIHVVPTDCVGTTGGTQHLRGWLGPNDHQIIKTK